MTEVKYVSWGKPGVNGAIFAAPIGTTLPTDAVSELDKAFKSLGYVSEDGMGNEDTKETDSVKAWGGDTVLTTYVGKEDVFNYALIEALNMEVLKHVYGDDNVKGDLKTGISIKSNSKPNQAHSIVIDMILKGGILKRIVIPNGIVAEVGEISYNDKDPIAYETTLNCQPDKDGNTHYEYMIEGKKGVENV